MQTRKEQFTTLFPDAPRYRIEQIERGLYERGNTSWDDITTLSKSMREELNKQVDFLSIKDSQVLISKNKDTHKAMLTMADGAQIETVLMKNKRDHWTICVSSQVGCAMACSFCATGEMGFKRNLTQDEIVDQYRFWLNYIAEDEIITNVVFMGMGEPLANYDNVKATMNEWLEYTSLGKTKITVSTVGMIPVLEKLLKDPEWPHVRLAVSLHSADRNTRMSIVKTSYEEFLPKLTHWAKRYLDTFGNKKHHLTFEHVMLKNINDTDKHAVMLANYVNKIGNVKVNLIPYNFTGSEYKKSDEEQIERFKEILEEKGVTVTRRKTMGDDIAAACGQLIKLGKK